MRWEFKRLFIRTKENFGEAFVTLGEDLKAALYEAFVQLPKEVASFVKRVWDYRILLWEDRDWDYQYILNMLEFKISRTKKSIEKYHHHVNWKRDVKSMQKALDMLQSIREETVSQALYDGHDEKWGKSQITSVKIKNSSSSQVRIVREKAYTPDQQTQERKEYRKLMKRAARLEQNLWNRFWAHLNKDIRGWWD